MIYQLKAYYGALLNNKAVYTAEIAFNDCTKPFDAYFDEEPIKSKLLSKISEDGFNPNDFTFCWITKEQYDNKIESKIDEEYTFKD